VGPEACDDRDRIRLLALACSPRPQGNTSLLLDEFIRGAADHGCQVEKIDVAALRISPCSHCGHCRNEPSCPLQDGMQQLYPKLSQADALVLASPIYFMAHAAQAKCLIDRCQLFWAYRYVLGLQPERPSHTRRGVFLAAGATHGRQVFAGAQVTMRWFFDALQIEYWGNLLFEGLEAAGAVRGQPAALQQARQMGTRLAQEFYTR